jgi:hypothetical protein
MITEMPPWQSQSAWNQIELFFYHSCRNTESLIEAEQHAAEISTKLKAADDIFQDLCRQTCIACSDICCAKATIWYDFNDLLFYYLRLKKSPKKQIVRKKGQNCPQLTAKGCSLERLQRPFICTWYLCPDQSHRTVEIQGVSSQNLSDLLLQIKEKRKLMELSFLKSVTP